MKYELTVEQLSHKSAKEGQMQLSLPYKGPTSEI